MVKSVEGQTAVIVTESKLACNGCKVASGCGHGIIEGYLAPKLFETPVSNSIGARPSDKVLVEIEESALTRASLLIYSLPLMVMFLSSMLGATLTSREGWIVVAGFAGLAMGLALVRYLVRHRLNMANYEPKIRPLVPQMATNPGETGRS